MSETTASYNTSNNKNVPALKDLSDQEILDMDLEELAYLFLVDFDKQYSEDTTVSVMIIVRNVGNPGSQEVRYAICEAYQWLYNSGLIMENLTLDAQNPYFITRDGKKFLENKRNQQF